MRGFWADERVEGGLWNLRNPLFKMVYQFFKKKEKQFMTKADHIVSLTHNAKKEIESWRIGTAPITVIHTCVDLDLFDPSKIKKEDQMALRKSLGISEDDFVLLYLGSWGTWYLTEEMLGFFSILKQQMPNAKFLIVSPDKVNLEKYVNKEAVIVNHSSRQQVPIHISLADLSICFIKPSFSKKASSATKLGEVMAMGLPVVANGDWGDIDWFAETEKSVLKVNLQNMKVPDLSRSLQVNNNRAFANSYLSLDGAITAYKNVYTLLKGGDD
jgi:glycosyltransferase involved in cell wall biosynthesis